MDRKDAQAILRERGIERGMDPRSLEEIAEQVVRTGSPAVAGTTILEGVNDSVSETESVEQPTASSYHKSYKGTVPGAYFAR